MSVEATYYESDEIPDIDAYDEQLWELYLNYCQQRGQKPSIKDYIIWKEENYE